MKKTVAQRWETLREESKSPDDLQRTSALAVGAKCVEIALTAAGFTRQNREGIQARLRNYNLLGRSGFPPETAIKSAFEARNEAIHTYVVPSQKECARHITTFLRIWGALRDIFVSKQTACRLAHRFLEHPSVNSVYLFGSLSRSATKPQDIDFLLFDDGAISGLLNPRWKNYWAPEWMFEDELLFDAEHRAAIRSGWLDIVVVDGNRFGRDKDYTVHMWRTQPIPLFFINIARDLLKYDANSRHWEKQSPEYFERLVSIYELMEEHYVVVEHRERLRG